MMGSTKYLRYTILLALPVLLLNCNSSKKIVLYKTDLSFDYPAVFSSNKEILICNVESASVLFFYNIKEKSKEPFLNLREIENIPGDSVIGNLRFINEEILLIYIIYSMDRPVGKSMMIYYDIHKKKIIKILDYNSDLFLEHSTRSFVFRNLSISHKHDNLRIVDVNDQKIIKESKIPYLYKQKEYDGAFFFANSINFLDLDNIIMFDYQNDEKVLINYNLSRMIQTQICNNEISIANYTYIDISPDKRILALTNPFKGLKFINLNNCSDFSFNFNRKFITPCIFIHDWSWDSTRILISVKSDYYIIDIIQF